jgi:hypothetical protein
LQRNDLKSYASIGAEAAAASPVILSPQAKDLAQMTRALGASEILPSSG